MPQCDGSLAITVSSITDSPCGEEVGKITVSASGGAGGYQFQLNDGEFGSGNSFETVGAGAYVVKVKDANDCSADVNANVVSGIVYADVQTLIETNCAISNCHDGTNNRREDLTQLSVIRTNAADLKTRINERSMPPEDQDTLTQQEINQLSCWVTDGAPE
ncbi:MAG: SprB repeat-containing protein [Bacteroidota bacterium]